MTAALLTALPVIVGLLASLIQLWNAKAPERKQEATNDKNQQGRQDIANGNADAVAVRVDRVLSVSESVSGDPPRIESAEDFSRRISQL
jgi:hypothetical protein